MPLAFHKPYAKDGCLGLWHIEENIADMIHLFEKSYCIDTKNLLITHRLRRKQWYGSRLLLQALAKRLSLPCWGFRKDAHQRPSLLGTPAHVSLSHAYPYAFAALHPHAVPGVDIEPLGEQALRVADKFLSATEQRLCARSPVTCTLFWAAKEAVYKALALRLRFKADIQLSFPPKPSDKKALLAHVPLFSAAPLCVQYELYAKHVLAYTHVLPAAGGAPR